MVLSRIHGFVLSAAVCLAVVLTLAPAQAGDRYGSIFFSQEYDGGYAWGMAWSYDSQSAARDRAMNECRSRGGTSCSEIAWFRNACGSLAIGDNNGYGYGWGDTSGRASSEAMSGCQMYNRNCSVIVTRCTD